MQVFIITHSVIPIGMDKNTNHVGEKTIHHSHVITWHNFSTIKISVNITGSEILI